MKRAKQAEALPVPGQVYKRDGLTRTVEKVDRGLPGLDIDSVVYRIRYGSQDEIHLVSLSNWNRWAEKARKVDS